jgi:hypothetical protein
MVFTNILPKNFTAISAFERCRVVVELVAVFKCTGMRIASDPYGAAGFFAAVSFNSVINT